MKRSAPITRTRLRRRSDKAVAKDTPRKALVASVLDKRPNCQAGAKIASVEGVVHCAIRSQDVHEVKTRARGGSILDQSNVLAVCRWCHDWIHGHPKQAVELQLLKNSWDD